MYVLLFWYFDGTTYLVLFGSKKYDFIYNKIWYLIGVKSGITYVISHNYAKIKIDSYDSLPLEETMTFLMANTYLSQFSIKMKITTTVIYS